jgi:CPA1 family monovalent cation:H+ antiporter
MIPINLIDRWNGLHPTVAATLGGLLCALILFALEHLGWSAAILAHGWIARIDFSFILLRGLLAFLLFAGALHVDMDSLKKEAGFVAILSTLGVIVSTLFVGFALRLFLARMGKDLSWESCLLFGAIVSPTDPVAVLAIFRRAKVPRVLAVTVGAESLFNDGTAVVLFSSILGATTGLGDISLPRALGLFLMQCGGGLVCGLLLGELARLCADKLRTLPVQVAATAVVAFLGYTAANMMGVSGLLAAICAGIRVGGRNLRLKASWTFIDAGLNMAVFFLLGLLALVVPWREASALMGVLAVVLVLLGRALSVALPMAAMRPWRSFIPGTFRALTWGGLRGAVPLALALSLPAGPDKALLVTLTYGVGLFSLIVQGSTL